MTKKNIFPVVATIAVVGVVLGVFSTTVLRDSNVSISTMTSEQAYAAKEYKKNGEGKTPRWRHYWCGNSRERRECKFIY